MGFLSVSNKTDFLKRQRGRKIDVVFPFFSLFGQNVFVPWSTRVHYCALKKVEERGVFETQTLHKCKELRAYLLITTARENKRKLSARTEKREEEEEEEQTLSPFTTRLRLVSSKRKHRREDLTTTRDIFESFFLIVRRLCCCS